MVKRLRRLFGFEEYQELAKFLGVQTECLYRWKRKGTPGNINGLLKVIERQQKEIQKLQEEKNVSD